MRQHSLHSRSASTPGQPLGLRSAPNTPLYPPTPTTEGLPAKGSVRSAISTFERLNKIEPPSSTTPSSKQRPYRAAMDYWKEVKAQASEQANTGITETASSTSSNHSRGLSHDSGDKSFMRMVHERRSAREVRQRPMDTQARLRSSQEELDKIGTGPTAGSLGKSRQNSLEDSLESYRKKGNIPAQSRIWYKS